MEADELVIDDHGRISGTSEMGVDYSTRSYRGLVSHEALDAPAAPAAANEAKLSSASGAGPLLRDVLAADCRKVFCSESFWIGASDQPRCTLERLAKRVWEFHTAGVRGYTERSGAEWWVQVRLPGAAAKTIGFHWDKDEDLVDEAGINIFPQVSTVWRLQRRASAEAWRRPCLVELNVH